MFIFFSEIGEGEVGLVIKVNELMKSKQLWSADKGKLFRDMAIKNYHANKNTDELEINLCDIEVADTSFIREGFVKLIVELSVEYERPRLFFSNVSDYMLENLDTAFFKHERFAVTLHNKKIKLIGKYSQQINETLKVLFYKKRATASMVAQSLDIQLNTVNNRLMKLYKMATINRKELGQDSGGKEFEYSFPFFYQYASSDTMKEFILV